MQSIDPAPEYHRLTTDLLICAEAYDTDIKDSLPVKLKDSQFLCWTDVSTSYNFVRFLQLFIYNQSVIS